MQQVKETREFEQLFLALSCKVCSETWYYEQKAAKENTMQVFPKQLHHREIGKKFPGSLV